VSPEEHVLVRSSVSGGARVGEINCPLGGRVGEINCRPQGICW
jgi:hypothetical protein